jgi:hypothetical protein
MFSTFAWRRFVHCIAVMATAGLSSSNRNCQLSFLLLARYQNRQEEIKSFPALTWLEFQVCDDHDLDHE